MDRNSYSWYPPYNPNGQNTGVSYPNRVEEEEPPVRRESVQERMNKLRPAFLNPVPICPEIFAKNYNNRPPNPNVSSRHHGKAPSQVPPRSSLNSSQSSSSRSLNYTMPTPPPNLKNPHHLEPGPSSSRSSFESRDSHRDVNISRGQREMQNPPSYSHPQNHSRSHSSSSNSSTRHNNYSQNPDNRKLEYGGKRPVDPRRQRSPDRSKFPSTSNPKEQRCEMQQGLPSNHRPYNQPSDLYSAPRVHMQREDPRRREGREGESSKGDRNGEAAKNSPQITRANDDARRHDKAQRQESRESSGNNSFNQQSTFNKTRNLEKDRRETSQNIRSGTNDPSTKNSAPKQSMSIDVASKTGSHQQNVSNTARPPLVGILKKSTPKDITGITITDKAKNPEKDQRQGTQAIRSDVNDAAIEKSKGREGSEKSDKAKKLENARQQGVNVSKNNTSDATKNPSQKEVSNSKTTDEAKKSKKREQLQTKSASTDSAGNPSSKKTTSSHVTDKAKNQEKEHHQKAPVVSNDTDNAFAKNLSSKKVGPQSKTNESNDHGKDSNINRDTSIKKVSSKVAANTIEAEKAAKKRNHVDATVTDKNDKATKKSSTKEVTAEQRNESHDKGSKKRKHKEIEAASKSKDSDHQKHKKTKSTENALDAEKSKKDKNEKALKDKRLPPIDTQPSASKKSKTSLKDVSSKPSPDASEHSSDDDYYCLSPLRISYTALPTPLAFDDEEMFSLFAATNIEEASTHLNDTGFETDAPMDTSMTNPDDYRKQCNDTTMPAIGELPTISTVSNLTYLNYLLPTLRSHVLKKHIFQAISRADLLPKKAFLDFFGGVFRHILFDIYEELVPELELTSCNLESFITKLKDAIVLYPLNTIPQSLDITITQEIWDKRHFKENPDIFTEYTHHEIAILIEAHSIYYHAQQQSEKDARYNYILTHADRITAWEKNLKSLLKSSKRVHESFRAWYAIDIYLKNVEAKLFVMALFFDNEFRILSENLQQNINISDAAKMALTFPTAVESMGESEWFTIAVGIFFNKVFEVEQGDVNRVRSIREVLDRYPAHGTHGVAKAIDELSTALLEMKKEIKKDLVEYSHEYEAFSKLFLMTLQTCFLKVQEAILRSFNDEKSAELLKNFYAKAMKGEFETSNDTPDGKHVFELIKELFPFVETQEYLVKNAEVGNKVMASVIFLELLKRWSLYNNLGIDQSDDYNQLNDLCMTNFEKPMLSLPKNVQEALWESRRNLYIFSTPIPNKLKWLVFFMKPGTLSYRKLSSILQYLCTFEESDFATRKATPPTTLQFNKGLFSSENRGNTPANIYQSVFPRVTFAQVNLEFNEKGVFEVQDYSFDTYFDGWEKAMLQDCELFWEWAIESQSEFYEIMAYLDDLHNTRAELPLAGLGIAPGSIGRASLQV